MKTGTLSNLVWLSVCGLFGIAAFVVAAVSGAWWNYPIALACWSLARAYYTDGDSHTESVRDFFARMRKERRKV